MSDNEQEVLRIARLLTPENQTDLLAWVHLAYKAENSAKQALALTMERVDKDAKRDNCAEYDTWSRG